MTRHGIIVIAVLLGGITSAQQSGTPRPVRHINAQAGQDIVGQLRPTDTALHVIRQATPPFAGGAPEADKELEALTRAADAVAIVRIVAKHAQLTPMRDWITSNVDASVIEVLKNTPAAEVSPARVISFAEDGGELELGNQHIIASLSWAVSTKQDREYLMFLFQRQDGTLASFGPTFTFELRGVNLHRLLARKRTDWKLEEAQLDWVKTQIRAKAHLRRSESGR